MAKYRDEHGEQKILTIISDFLISKWISNVCSTDIGLHGLSKDFYLEQNCKDNLKLLGELLTKIFKFE